MIDQPDNEQNLYPIAWHHDDIVVLLAIIFLFIALFAHLTRHRTSTEAPFSVWEITATRPRPETNATTVIETDADSRQRHPHVLSETTVAGKVLTIEQFIPFSGQIDINHADEKMLMLLEGIGVKTARAIIAYRQGNGPFTHISQLMRVPGIGRSTYLRLSPLLTVGRDVETDE